MSDDIQRVSDLLKICDEKDAEIARLTAALEELKQWNQDRIRYHRCEKSFDEIVDKALSGEGTEGLEHCGPFLGPPITPGQVKTCSCGRRWKTVSRNLEHDPSAPPVLVWRYEIEDLQQPATPLPDQPCEKGGS